MNTSSQKLRQFSKLALVVLCFLNNSMKAYSNFTDFFRRDSVRAVHRIEASYPKKYFLCLDLFERYNYHRLVYLKLFVIATPLLLP